MRKAKTMRASSVLLSNGKHLTARELEVISMLMDGLSQKECAEKLFVSHRTITTLADRVRIKIGKRNLFSCAVYLIREGILS
jgi:DNA-binding NarL/FixJ family response regulator